MSMSLKPISVSVLKELKKKDGIEASSLAKVLKVDYIEVMSGINELSEHGLGEFKEESIVEYSLTEEGKDYAENKLPESRLFKYLVDNDIKQIDLKDLKEAAGKKIGLDEKIFFISLNNLKRIRWTSQTKIEGKAVVLVLKQEYEDMPEQALLALLSKSKVMKDTDVAKDLQGHVKVLKNRNLVSEKKYTERILILSDKGKKLDASKVTSKDEVTKLTKEMITSGNWDKINFKPYDVTKPGPRIFPGKIHPLVEIINKIREIFFSMGFIEIRGPIIESAFFNFDALWQPQDHPAREMHDTFYLSNPAKAKLPAGKYVDAVAAAHENGFDTGSTGWGYKWNKDIAQKTILRTHTTATTVRQLGKAIQEGVKLPLKVFSIDRVFRNEKVDFSHLAEFMQVEGIVIGENVTLADLRGTLVEFYKKMGFDKVITRPGFFPYTEPSMEISVYSKELNTWMEIGGSGIFRPEVCSPWGIKEPVRVLAWGQGLERIAMLRLKRKDIRDLYKNPLSWLREASYPKLYGDEK
ncbi:MAG: phenylalanine--tRNA ligase subunit alpha [Candidatus Hodarchaeota archaeon]